jgi:hypothetical protein
MTGSLYTYSAETITTAVLAFAALISAIYAWRANVTAKRALHLAEIDFKEKHGDVHTYLIDSMTWSSKAGDLYFSAACLFSNTSSTPTTILRVELVLHTYSASPEESTKIKLNPQFAEITLPIDLPELSNPINLGPRITASGWLTFKIPKHIASTKKVDQYEIISTESTGKQSSINAYIVKKVEIGDPSI